MRHKTSGYFLLSALLVSLILGLCILLNLRCPQAVSDDALTQEQLTRGVTLTGWQQTGPGHWRFAFEAPADVPELVLCLSTRSLDAVPEGLEPTDQRGEAFWVRPVPGRTSEITVTSTTVPQMWLMLPDTLWHWRELRSSLQLMALVAFASMGAGILALFCFKPQHELGVFLLYLGVMFGWGLAVLLPAGQTGALLGFLMGLYFPFAVLTPLWLCCSLLHVALPRRGSRHFALSVLGVLLFLVLGTSTQAVLRNVTLLAGMAAVLVVLARALAKKERPAWYLLAAMGHGESMEVSILELANPLFINALPYTMGVVLIWFLIAFWANTSIIKAATGAKPLDRRENKRVYNLVENLCMANGMKTPKINIINDDSLNAFASGINDRTYTVTLSKGIIQKLNDEELEAVIAHELTHIRNRDVRLLIVSIVFVGIFSMLTQITFYTITHARIRSNGKNGGGAILIILIALVIAAVGYFFASLMRFAISRKREYMADAGSAEMTKNPLALASALRKISDDPDIEAVKRGDVAQLFIQNPGDQSKSALSGLSGLFATHPPIEKRISILEQF